MSKMKSLGLMYAMAAMMGGGLIADRSSVDASKVDGKPKEPPKPNGLKKFNIDGVEVWAINEKNARRKAAKLGGIS